MKLAKANIAIAVAEHTGYLKNSSFEMIVILLGIIKITLESGEDIMSSGFGKFCGVIK